MASNLDVSVLLGVPLSYAHVIITYLPGKDRDEMEFDVEPWETEALKLQGQLFRGATSYPSRGGYRRSDQTGEIVEEQIMLEQTRMVTSFVQEEDFNETPLVKMQTFLLQFKNETYQDSVAIVVDSEMYYL